MSIPGADPPVEIRTAGYSGPEPCSRCGKSAAPGFRVMGRKGDVARYLVLCARCYQVFQEKIGPFFRDGQAKR